VPEFIEPVFAKTVQKTLVLLMSIEASQLVDLMIITIVDLVR
jgi:hypothetical protein